MKRKTITKETELDGYEPLKVGGVISECYRINPVKGTIINKHNHMIGVMDKRSEYMVVSLAEFKKTCNYHRLVYEHVNGPIPDKMEIDHDDENRFNNMISNLVLMTASDNRKKACVKRDFSFTKTNHTRVRPIIAINQETNEESEYKSMYATCKATGVNAGIVKMVCDGSNRCKSGNSKHDGVNWTFRFAEN